MAKNTQSGAVIVNARIPVKYEGTVLAVTKAGVKIETRDYGKQSAVERFFAKSTVIAHTNEGAGFVVVWENRPVAAFHGEIVADGSVSVDIGDKREVVFYDTDGGEMRIDYDANEQPSSVPAKIAKRETDKLGTAMRRMDEKASGGASATKKKKKKK